MILEDRKDIYFSSLRTCGFFVRICLGNSPLTAHSRLRQSTLQVHVKEFQRLSYANLVLDYPRFVAMPHLNWPDIAYRKKENDTCSFEFLEA